MKDLSDYPVDPIDEAKSAALLKDNPIIYMPHIAVTGFIEDGETQVVISFSDDNGTVLNFLIGNEVAAEVGQSLVMASQRAKEIEGDPKGTKQ